MSDWRSYDPVAEDYERIWTPRLAQAARHVIALARPRPGAHLLDLGTGTGVVPFAAVEAVGESGRLVGCDISGSMLARARQRVPSLLAVVTDATSLPFRADTFHLVTANLVLSHLADYATALGEVRRVLRPGGHVAASSWGPGENPYDETWREVLAATLGKDALDSAGTHALPWEGYFVDSNNLIKALTQAAFTQVRVEVAVLRLEFAREEYLASRKASVIGRFARHHLDPARWRAICRKAREEFLRRFEEPLTYDRPLSIALGIKP